MSYVDKNLMDGEQVMHRTRRHWIVYIRPLLVMFMGLALFAIVRIWGEPDAASAAQYALWIGLGIAALMAIPVGISRRTSEFAVTNKRVIVKVGWIQRRSLETLLTKIEAIEVIQGIWGRMLDYGTIIIIGTGGTKEHFELIASPLVFRRKVQEQILALQTAR